MAAGLYTYPLFVSLLAGPFLGEKIGPWRISALLIGAIGALLMLDPFTSEFSYVQLLPVVAGFFYACNLLILRRACRGENPLALTFAVAICFFKLANTAARSDISGVNCFCFSLFFFLFFL